MKYVLLIFLYFISGNFAYSQKITVSSELLSIKKNFRKHILGKWEAIYYSFPTNAAYALTQKDVDECLVKGISFKKDAIYLFGDTITPLVIDFKLVKRDDFLFETADFSEQFKKMKDVFYVVTIRGNYKFNSDYVIDERHFAYDGKYIITNVEGVPFMLRKRLKELSRVGWGLLSKELN